MIVVFLIMVLVFGGLIKYILGIRHNEKYLNRLKTMNPVWPFIGNGVYIASKTVSDLFEKHYEFVLKNGTPFKTRIGSFYNVFLDKPEDVKTILMSSKCLDKPYLYSFYPCPQGLLTQQSGADWKPVRKIMNPVFNLKVLQSFLPIFNAKTKHFLNNLDAHVGNSEFDVLPYANYCTLDAICSTVMGLDIDLKSNRSKEFIHSMHAIVDILMMRALNPLIHLDFVYKWTKMYKEEQQHMFNCRYFTNHVFDEKSKSFLASQNNNHIGNEAKKPQLPIMQLLYEGALSKDLVRQQIEILVIAGFETTALTISFAILMVAMHPNIQEDLFAELRSVYDSQDEDTTYEHIQKLNLLDRVLKETMRHFPVAPVIARTSKSDMKVGDLVIPRNAGILILIGSMHRRHDIWGENSDQFNPDHFLPENVEKRHPFAFLPFSGGPRNCIGYLYAMFSLKVMLSAILRHYKLSTDLRMSDLELKYGVSLHLKNKHMIKVERRSSWSG